MNSRTEKQNLSQHILPNSSMMIGVCMTVISITKVVGLHHEQHRITEVFAFDALIFLVSALLSYVAMRNESDANLSCTSEKLADMAFILGLILMTLAGFLLTYELI